MKYASLKNSPLSRLLLIIVSSFKVILATLSIVIVHEIRILKHLSLRRATFDAHQAESRRKSSSPSLSSALQNQEILPFSMMPYPWEMASSLYIILYDRSETGIIQNMLHAQVDTAETVSPERCPATSSAVHHKGRKTPTDAWIEKNM